MNGADVRILTLLALLISLPALAEDVVLTHQVRVLDASGLAIEGARTLTVELYADEDAVTPLWSETFETTLTDGYATLLLGNDSSTPLPGDIAADVRFAQMLVDGEAIGARQRLSGVPLSARSLMADSVSGDVTVGDLKLETETSGTCSGASDYGKIRWDGGAFQGCRPGGWSNMLMAEPGDDATTGMATTPGLIAYFEGACPEGWSEKTELRGRVVVAATSNSAAGETVGVALNDLGTRAITQAPSHSHSVTSATATSSSAGGHSHSIDPPSTRSGNQTANHTHSVDPPNTNTSAGGGHDHGIRTRQDDYNVSGGSGPSYGADNGPYAVRHRTDAVGNHAHSLNIGAFNSGTISANHQHDLNIAAFESSTAAGHTHSTTISGQTAAATGPESVDVTMPYIHMVGCELD